MSSQAVQDYLKAIYALSGEGRPATTGEIADRLSVAPPSATNMVKRLARRGLAKHTPYRAVELTEAGRRLALTMVRRHRLLELYLERVLGLGVEQVHEEAERLEHALSDALETRLDDLLGHPASDPHGEPIPPRVRPAEAGRLPG
ncbi:MAG: metal-dependent transcriptional regulator [Armatimonadetes bacterium]|nr:metal-dependent transcriptional regulator [Armatimonadota bacterium]